MSSISPCLWFDGKAEEAAAFYVSLFPNSKIDNVVRAAMDFPGTAAGAALVVSFTLDGQSYTGLNGGPHFTFNEAISLAVSCEDQAEVDRLWQALTADGGAPVQCGWLKDKYGLSWQIVPKALQRMMQDTDTAKVARASAAMMQMIKLDIATLEAAFNSR